MFSWFLPPPCPSFEVCYIRAGTQEGGGMSCLRGLATVGGSRHRGSVVLELCVYVPTQSLPVSEVRYTSPGFRHHCNTLQRGARRRREPTELKHNRNTKTLFKYKVHVRLCAPLWRFKLLLYCSLPLIRQHSASSTSFQPGPSLLLVTYCF